LIVVERGPHLLGDFFAGQSLHEQFLMLIPRSPAGTVRRRDRERSPANASRRSIRCGERSLASSGAGATSFPPYVSLRGAGGGTGASGLRVVVTGERRSTATIKLKRAYEKPSRDDGSRILVERLWPRGLTKERAAVDLWLKEVAPSAELRKWFGHDPAKWEQFQKRYWKELEEKEEAVGLLKQKGKQGTLTLVYAARDEEHNGALALKQFLKGHKR
jgi:uncharacterized protein YeaO (DUF488 family)